MRPPLSFTGFPVVGLFEDMNVLLVSFLQLVVVDLVNVWAVYWILLFTCL